MEVETEVIEVNRVRLDDDEQTVLYKAGELIEKIAIAFEDSHFTYFKDKETAFALDKMLYTIGNSDGNSLRALATTLNTLGTMGTSSTGISKESFESYLD